MKVIAKTTSPIMLVDPVSRAILEQDPPRVVPWSNFFESRTGKGQIKILGSDLPPEASDEEFQKYLAEAEDLELAVAAYVSSFGEAEEDAVEPQKSDERLALEAEAESLEVKFRANISDEKLAEKIAEAKAGG